MAGNHLVYCWSERDGAVPFVRRAPGLDMGAHFHETLMRALPDGL